MKRALKKRSNKIISVSDLRKDRFLRADLCGDISGLSGDISADLYGDIDDCNISAADRKNGININDLIS